ncbi:uncharacterized protein LOC123682509 isoform X2 [Harmonia axyridis]|uniref:uncharacterized protein LOC123682509 isoform X2 n=1 Tax=Harmonia axyridis TaxID=115357 RepID=UPI001E278CF7|nr:uncharacterized protein LOC123682509 isoform X2 [Harmonia axyridis]
MNSKVYKWCMVPMCKNTSITTPNKLFLYVPNKKIMRDKWLELAGRNPAEIVSNSPVYFCEDHFDLPNDMENYMEYRVMGFVSQVRKKPGCIPTKFACQTYKNNQSLSDTIEPQNICNKRKVTALEKCEKQSEEIASGSSVEPEIIYTEESKTDCKYGEDSQNIGSPKCEPKIKKEKLDDIEDIKENVSKNNFIFIKSEIPEEVGLKEEDEYSLVEQLLELVNQTETVKEELADASDDTIKKEKQV